MDPPGLEAEALGLSGLPGQVDQVRLDQVLLEGPAAQVLCGQAHHVAGLLLVGLARVDLQVGQVLEEVTKHR